MEGLYQIKLSYATFGISTYNDIVIKTAPIGKWMIGKDINFIINWTFKKGGTVLQLWKH